MRREGQEGISTSPRRVRVRVIALAGAMPGSLRPIRRGPRPLKQEYGQKVLERLGLDNPKEAEQAEASTMRISPRSARPTTDMRDSSMSPRCVSLMFWPGGSCVCLFTPSISLSLFPVPSTESHAALLLPVENGKEWQEGEKRGRWEWESPLSIPCGPDSLMSGRQNPQEGDEHWIHQDTDVGNERH